MVPVNEFFNVKFFTKSTLCKLNKITKMEYKFISMLQQIVIAKMSPNELFNIKMFVTQFSVTKLSVTQNSIR